MAATRNSRFDGRSSNFLIFAVSAGVALAVAFFTYQPSPDVAEIEREARAGETVRASPRCLEADRAIVAQLASVLQRNNATDAAILERAIHTLNVARRHCLYTWDGRGLEDYQWLDRWLSAQN